MRRRTWGIAVAAVLLAAFPSAATRAPKPPRAPRSARAIDLPGDGGVVDIRRHCVYQWRFVGRARHVLAFDWQRRRIVWERPVEDYTEPFSVSGRTLICVPKGSSDQPWGPLLGTDARSGTVRWREPIAAYQRYGFMGLTVTHGLIFKTCCALVQCLEAATGRVVWITDFGQAEAGAGWPHDPVVVGVAVYTQTGGRVVALDARNGKVRWWHPADSVSFEAGDMRCFGPIAAAAGRVVGLIPTGPQELAPGTEMISNPPSGLACWDARTGKRLWQREAPWSNEPLVVTERGVALRGWNDRPYGYSLWSGQQLWQLGGTSWDLTPWQPYGAEFLVGEVSTVAGKERAYLGAIDAAQGRRRWRLRLPPAESVAVIASATSAARIFVIAGHSIPHRVETRNRLYVIDAPPARVHSRTRRRARHRGQPGTKQTTGKRSQPPTERPGQVFGLTEPCGTLD
jgi:outer membrane protein assembly factor BamB